MYLMRLPELNCLVPDEYSTFKKIVEEISECNQAVENLVLFEKEYSKINWLLLSDNDLKSIRQNYKSLLSDVLGEIMDIAQTCVSQLFVFERKNIDIESVFKDYFSTEQRIFYTKNNCRYIHLERTCDEENIHTVLNKIILSMGTIAQLDKFIGRNGEKRVLDTNDFLKKYIIELFRIIQNCFNLLYIFNHKYSIDLDALFNQHVEKLIRKGYYNPTKDHE